MNRGYFIVLFVIVAIVSGGYIVTNTQSRSGSNPVGQIAQAIFPQVTPKPLSIVSFPIASPQIPSLATPVASCDRQNNVQHKLSWTPTEGAVDYILYRNNVQLAMVTGTEYTDTSGLVLGKDYCYSVRSRVQDVNPFIGKVVSADSNMQCAVASCNGSIVVSVPSGVQTANPTPTLLPGQPMPTPTRLPGQPTPTKTPTPTPTLVPTPTVLADCQSTTVFNAKRVINARKFGMDATAIQKALDCFKDPAYGGGAVYVPAGTYIVTNKIRVFSNVTLFGDGIDQTILQLDSSLAQSEDGILGNDTNRGHENITVRDMTMRGLFEESGRLGCCAGIKLRQLDGGYFYNIKVEGFSWYGIWLVYKQQRSSGGSDIDGVEHVRISNCQILNNKGSGIALDSPSSQNVVDNCILSGNNSGNGQDGYLKSGAAISLFMDEDGIVTKNKILGNTIQNNSFRGISVLAKNDIRSIFNDGKLLDHIPDNAICNNTVENNSDVGIADGNSQESVYIANRIINNNDARNGKVTTGSIRYYDNSINRWGTTPSGSSLAVTENESPAATSPDCTIPAALATIPQQPTKPPSVQGAATSAPQPSSIFERIMNVFLSLITL